MVIACYFHLNCKSNVISMIGTLKPLVTSENNSMNISARMKSGSRSASATNSFTTMKMDTKRKHGEISAMRKNWTFEEMREDGKFLGEEAVLAFSELFNVNVLLFTKNGKPLSYPLEEIQDRPTLKIFFKKKHYESVWRNCSNKKTHRQNEVSKENVIGKLKHQKRSKRRAWCSLGRNQILSDITQFWKRQENAAKDARSFKKIIVDSLTIRSSVMRIPKLIDCQSSNTLGLFLQLTQRPQ